MSRGCHLGQAGGVWPGMAGQGYRIWPRMDRAKASDHPERLRLRRIEMSGLAERRTLSARRPRTCRHPRILPVADPQSHDLAPTHNQLEPRRTRAESRLYPGQ
jgi:hypothetical protein